MIEYKIHHPDEISNIAASLADEFLKPLFDFCNERNYFVYIGSLAEIMDWSCEFYAQYHHKLADWEKFEHSQDNIFRARSKAEFLKAWGSNRIKLFYSELGKSRLDGEAENFRKD